MAILGIWALIILTVIAFGIGTGVLYSAIEHKAQKMDYVMALLLYALGSWALYTLGKLSATTLL